MNEVNKTLYVPLYRKSKVSRQGIILNDPAAEKIWKDEAFPIRGKSRSKWLAYNMAMRARVFGRISPDIFCLISRPYPTFWILAVERAGIQKRSMSWDERNC